MKYSYVSVEGLIGSGKTTVAKALAEVENARLFLEEFEENPFLPSFYKDPERYGFSVELSFLAQRFHQLKRVGERDLFQPLTIADHSLAKSLVFAQVNLSSDELHLFKELYEIMMAGAAQPELILYLHVPIERVLKQIKSRGRSYEQEISLTYLEKIQQHYLGYFQKMKSSRVVILEVPENHLTNDSKVFEGIRRLLSEEHPLGVSIRTLAPL